MTPPTSTSMTRPPDGSDSDRGPGRRALLAGLGVGALTLSTLAPAGCAADLPGLAAPDPDPDVAVVQRAITAIRETEKLLVATLRATPRNETRLRPWIAAHRAHRAALSQTLPDDVSNTDPTDQPSQNSPGTTTSPRPSLATVAAAEGRLREDLRTLALRADDGRLARLLGSIAAGLAQLATATNLGAAR